MAATGMNRLKIIGDGDLQARNESLSRRQADLELLNANLTQSNQDLEGFALVVSHDLQEPLRMMSAYAELLAEKYNGQLDPNATLCVTNIVEGVSRMRELLSSLSAYAEIGYRPPEPVETVDLNEVLENVKQNLKLSIEETSAVVSSDCLPAVRGHRRDFVPLFQNLVGNAIKYRCDCPPRIHISVELKEDELRFAVCDNGIGIDSKHHRQIFEPCRRLHGRSIPGTGLGLAICRRIVKRYTGRIWVESAPGAGATFFFTIPNNLA